MADPPKEIDVHDPTVRCSCGRNMTLEPRRGRGAYRCGCGARITITLPDPPRQCAGYNGDARCRAVPTTGLPIKVDLCHEHAWELRDAWGLITQGQEERELAEQRGMTVEEFRENYKLPSDVEFESRSKLADKVEELVQREGVVYYIQFGERIKIGTTFNLKKRLTAIPHDKVLATEPGSTTLERRRHRQFAHLRRGITEWFEPGPDLLAHIDDLRGS